MRYILLIAVVFAALAGCASQPANEPGPSWERNDPARRVYGGGA